jgi:CubicO group peptidase (beta-lactamase class C family)
MQEGSDSKANRDTLVLLAEARGVRACMSTVERQIDGFVNRERKKQHIPGLSLAVVRRGEVVKATGYGLADLENDVRARPDTAYSIASVSKQFTATGAMLLYQTGYLGLDDSVTDYLDRLPKAWKDVTVRHILTMTSGIIDIENDLPSLQDTVAMLAREYSDQDIVNLAAVRQRKFKAGDRYAYSNTGYHMLGMIIRSQTGMKWGDFLKERIFDPLGMENTRANDLSAIAPRRASGYWLGPSGYHNGPYVSQSMSAYAAGGLRSTVVDLAKWDASLYADKIVKPSTLDLMWTPVKLNDGSTYGYGFGWAVGERNGCRYVRHNGSRESGFEASMCRFLEFDLTVIVLTNRFQCNPTAIVEGVAEIFDPALKGS